MRLNLLLWTKDPCDGYGRWGLSLQRALQSGGVKVKRFMTKQIQRVTDWRHITVALIYGDHINYIEGRQIVWTMWEDTKPPPYWITRINRYAERLIVPCPHNAEAFKDAGVKVDIHVIGGGVDPAAFPVVESFPDRPFTFMTLGDRGMRKGWDTAMLAFWKAFPEKQYPDAKLVIKARNFKFTFPDKRITVWREDIPDMAEVYRQADAFVFPSKGEGFGLPPREAAAMGIPTIATRYAGLEVGIDHWCTVPLEPRICESIMGHGGNWGMPEVDDVADAMRYVYEQRDEARAKARQNAEWIRHNQSWDCTASDLMTLVNEYE